MVRPRAVLSFILICIWTAAPALACLPTSTMTKVEMECCKKMAGECHMDPRSHPCCEKTASRASAVAILQQLYLLHPNFAVATLDVQPDELIAQAFEADRLTLGLPPPGPPDLNSPLRI